MDNMIENGRKSLNDSGGLASIAITVGRRVLGSAVSASLIGGPRGRVFRLQGDASAVLKFGSSPGVEREAIVLQLLRDCGLPAPRVLQCKSVADDDEGCWILLEDLGPVTVASRLASRGSDAAELIREMGVVLARVHAVAVTTPRARVLLSSPPPSPNRYIERANRLVKIGVLRPEDVEVFAGLPIPNLDGDSLCHRDFHAVQCVVRNGRIVGVVDWDEARLAAPLLDLSITRTYLDCYAAPEQIAGFLDGYQSRSSGQDGILTDWPSLRMAAALGIVESAWNNRQLDLLRRATELWREYAAGGRV